MVTISGNNAVRVFLVNPGLRLELGRLIVANGGTVGFGGGILNLGTLIVPNSTFADNSADHAGGGICSGYRFRVEIDGVERAGFRECSGLTTSQDPIEYRKGADPGMASGLEKRASIVLQAGISSDAELWEWRQAARDGRAVRKSGTIIMLNEEGDEAMRWRFTAGWPIQWIGAGPDKRSGVAAIETLGIAHEGLSKA